MSRRLGLVLLLVPPTAFLLLAQEEEASRMGDVEGPIATWIWHFDPELLDEALPTYRALARVIPEEERILVAVERIEDLPALGRRFEFDDAFLHRLTFLPVGSPVTGWARDRYIAFRRGGQSVLLLPGLDTSDRNRQGDHFVPRALKEWDAQLSIEETPILLEGGNVLLASDHVICGVGVLVQNRARHGADPAPFVEELERLFGRSLLVVGSEATGVPHEHIDMFLAVAGPGRLLLGDPRLGLEYFRQREDLGIEGGDVRGMGTFTRAKQEELVPVYEAIAEELSGAGYAVDRLPILHSEARGDAVTWTNGVFERRDGELLAYLPAYGIPLLDRMAKEAWEKAGFRVFLVPAEKIIVEGGSVRCLSNVLRDAAEKK